MAWWSTRWGASSAPPRSSSARAWAERNDEVGSGAGGTDRQRRAAAFRPRERGAVRRPADRLAGAGRRRDPPGVPPGHRGDDPPDQHRIAAGAVVTVAIAAALSGSPAHDADPGAEPRDARPGGRRAGPEAGSRDTRRGRRAGRGVQPDSGAPPRIRGRALEFASDVSHELHALASAMQTAAQALQRGADGEPAPARATGHRAGRPHAPPRPPRRRSAGACAPGGRAAGDRARPRLTGGVAQQAVAEWTAEASWRHVTLELVADGAPLAYGDHERLVQAAGNLVENALKHTPRDGSVGVRVWSDQSGHHWRSTTRARASRRGPAVHLPPLLPGGRAIGRRPDRHGPRPGDRRADRAGARRRGQRDQRARRGQRLPHHAPAHAARIAPAM